MEEVRCVSDLGSQYFWIFFRFEGKFFLLRFNFEEIQPSVAIFGLFLGAFRCHFGAEFKAKKCQGSKEYVKKKWTALPRKAGT